MVVLLFFLNLFSNSPFLDPYTIDLDDILIDDSNFYSENVNKEHNESLFSKIKTENIFFIPQFFKNSSHYAIGADLIYAYTYLDANSPLSSLSLSLMLGSKDYFKTGILFDTYWHSDKNNLILSFDTIKYNKYYYSRGFSDSFFIANYNLLDLEAEITYRRKFYFLYLSFAYLYNSKNLNTKDLAMEIDTQSIALSGLSIGIDNKNSLSIINKRGSFLYGLYLSSYLKALSSYDNINAIKFDLEKNYFFSNKNKLNVYFEYNAYLKKELSYLTLFSPQGRLKPYSYNKYLDSQYTLLSLDLLVLLSGATYISINGGAYQTKSSFNDFVLNDNIYSYGLGLVFPLNKYLNSRLDYSISPDEKNIFISISSSNF